MKVCMNNEIWFTICNLTYSSTKEHFPLLGCVQNLPPSQPIELCSVNSTEIVPINADSIHRMSSNEKLVTWLVLETSW